MEILQTKSENKTVSCWVNKFLVDSRLKSLAICFDTAAFFRFAIRARLHLRGSVSSEMLYFFSVNQRGILLVRYEAKL